MVPQGSSAWRASFGIEEKPDLQAWWSRDFNLKSAREGATTAGTPRHDYRPPLMRHADSQSLFRHLPFLVHHNSTTLSRFKLNKLRTERVEGIYPSGSCQTPSDPALPEDADIIGTPRRFITPRVWFTSPPSRTSTTSNSTRLPVFRSTTARHTSNISRNAAISRPEKAK